MRVTVEDVNDNPPVFHGEPYTRTIEEGNKSLKALLVTLSTTDADFMINGSVAYKITSGNDKVNFTLNKTSVSVLVVFQFW